MTDYTAMTVAEFLAAGGSITPPDPDAEWREALDAYKAAAFACNGDDYQTTGLRAAVPLSPPYRELEKKLEEAVGLLRDIEHCDFDPDSTLCDRFFAFILRYKEQSNG